MRTVTLEEVEIASALLRTALDPKRTPRHDPVFRDHCEAYQTRSGVRDAAATAAGALGLTVLEVDPDFGVVVAPVAESPFAFPGSEFVTSGRTSVSDRHRDGIFLLAIIATAVPRREALVGDPRTALPPFSLDSVLQTLNAALTRAAERGEAPESERVDTDRPLWHIVHALPEVRETGDGRAGNRTRRQRCKLLLERLREVGAVDQMGDDEVWRPTWRWQVQLAAFARSGLWDSVRPLFWPTAPHLTTPTD